MAHDVSTLVIGIVSGTATIFLAIIAIIQAKAANSQANAAKTQTDLMKKEFDYSHRAWVGASSQGFEGKDPLTLWLHYKNFGGTTATNVIERWNFTTVEPTRDSIQKDQSHILQTSVNFPTQERGFPLKVDKQLKDDAVKASSRLYVWAIIDYDYSTTEKGQYGVIGRYDPKDNTIEIIDEWAT